MMLLSVPQVTSPSLGPVGLRLFCKVEGSCYKCVFKRSRNNKRALYHTVVILLTNVGLQHCFEMFLTTDTVD